jgi:hypothetical protein
MFCLNPIDVQINKEDSPPKNDLVGEAVISLENRWIHKYTEDGCEVNFCLWLFVCVFVSGKIVFFWLVDRYTLQNGHFLFVYS